MPSFLVVGVGQPLRRDDGAGLEAARRLQATLGTSVRIRTCEGDVTTLIDEWADTDAVILIDAMASGQPPGTIGRFDAHAGPMPATFSRSSTHAFGVAEAIELARALGQLPASMIVFGIEGLDFAMGEGLSPAIDAAVDAVVSEVDALMATAA